MSLPRFDLSTIEQWAYTTTLDEELARHEESDPDWFEVAIGNACPLKELFRFTADPRCLKRLYFAQLLIPNLCWIYRSSQDLPFHFSRQQGIMDRDFYLKKVAEHAEAVYERAELIERMRTSGDPALDALAKALLDHRHELLRLRREEYVELLRSVQSKVLPLFTNA